MAFTNSVVFSIDVPTFVDVLVIGTNAVGGTIGAKEAANVEVTTVDTIGKTVYGVVAN